MLPSVKFLICNVKGHRKVPLGYKHEGCLYRCMDCRAIVGNRCKTCLDIDLNLAQSPDEPDIPF